jgi:hypothetical protein
MKNKIPNKALDSLVDNPDYRRELTSSDSAGEFLDKVIARAYLEMDAIYKRIPT